jgi:hypothetical protein
MASAAGASEPVFPQGGISIGASGGVALIQMDDFNNFIQIWNIVNGTRYDSFSTGWDVEVDGRYAVSNKFFLGLQVGYIWAKTEDPVTGGRFDATGHPVLLIAGVSTKPDGGLVFRFLGGIGALVNGTLKEKDGFELRGTGFMGQLGGELEYRLFPAAGLTLQGVARTAKVADPKETETGALGRDLDFSGASVLLGIRGYFGGRKE